MTSTFSTFSLLVSASVASMACVATGVQAQMGTTAPAPTPAANLAAGAPPPPLVAPSLQTSNPFDPQRKVWPDRVPPPPPPPPPPPTPVTDQDLQLYGVVIAGPIKRATVKVGKRFAQLAPEGRPFANLSEGQPVGEFTLSKIEPTHLVLKARGGQQLVYFTKKTDRNTAAAHPVAAAPVQGASANTTDPAATAGGGTSLANAVANASTNTDGAAPTTASMPATTGAAGSMAVSNNGAAGNASATATNNTTTAPEANASSGFNSLAAALAAVKVNAGQRANGPFINPFLQQKR